MENLLMVLEENSETTRQYIFVGYRHIPLFAKNGNKLQQALIFVHITFQDDP